MLTNDREFRQQLHNLHVLAHSTSTSGAELAGLDFGPIPSPLMGTAPDYPAGADIKVWYTMSLLGGGEHCIRLFDTVADEALPNSTTCQSSTMNAPVISSIAGIDLSSVHKPDMIVT